MSRGDPKLATAGGVALFIGPIDSSRRPSLGHYAEVPGYVSSATSSVVGRRCRYQDVHSCRSSLDMHMVIGSALSMWNNTLA